MVHDEEDGDERGKREEDERARRAEHLLHPPRQAEPDITTEEVERGAAAVGEPPGERRDEERGDDGEAGEEREEDRRAPPEEEVPPRAEDGGEEEDGVPEEIRDEPVRDRRADEPERVLGLGATRVKRVAERERAGERVVGGVVRDEGEGEEERQRHEHEAEHLGLALAGDERGVGLLRARTLLLGPSRGSAHVGGRTIRGGEAAPGRLRENNPAPATVQGAGAGESARGRRPDAVGTAQSAVAETVLDETAAALGSRRTTRPSR